MVLGPGVPDPPATLKVIPKPSSRMPFEQHQSLAGCIIRWRLPMCDGVIADYSCPLASAQGAISRTDSAQPLQSTPVYTVYTSFRSNSVRTGRTRENKSGHQEGGSGPA